MLPYILELADKLKLSSLDLTRYIILCMFLTSKQNCDVFNPSVFYLTKTDHGDVQFVLPDVV